MTKIDAPEGILDRIRQGNRFLITAHSNPDGDAIGSEVGLARILRTMGIGASIWNLDTTPELYANLAGVDRIHVGDTPPRDFPKHFDGVIVLECPTLDRTGLESHLAEQQILNIDHHLGNQQYGQFNWVDPSAPAVAEMVLRLAQGLKAALDDESATALYLALVSDTGGFRYANTSAQAFESAAELVRNGAMPDQVSGWLYESQPAPSIRLLGAMLSTMEITADGRVATALVTREMYERADAQESHTENLINYPRSIAGVEVVALLRELANGKVKISLRSKGDVDVERIATRHGGGGHRNAAGFTKDESDSLREQVIAELSDSLS